jgi:drug/metabolite transporter (DMT)-like permease
MSRAESATILAPAADGPDAAATGPAAPSRRWIVDLVLLGALWGASFLFMRIAAPEFGALPAATMRVAIATLVLVPLMLLRDQGPALLRHWKPMLGIGILNSGLPFALFCFALLTLTSGAASVLNATVPMFGALVAWVWFGERPGGSRIVGLVIGFTGVALLASRSAGFHVGADPDGGHAAIWAVAACLSYGISASATRRFLAGVPPMASAAGSQIGATLFLALPAAWLWPARMPSAKAWLAMVALGVVCTGLAYILFFRLIDRAGPARALTVTFLVPVFAVFYGAVFLDERVTPWMLGCAAVIVCGVVLSTGLVGFGRRKSDREDRATRT